MKILWTKLRIPLIITALLLTTVAFLRIFSGPEDTWIKNEKGQWVPHGCPSSSSPSSSLSHK